MAELVNSLARGWTSLERRLDQLQPLAALSARAYLAQVFFLSGLTKIRDWDTTLALFAEWLGTGSELVLPLLLLFGLGGRFAALGLSVLNAVAVLSLTDIAPAALQQHWFWGSLLAALAIYGSGSLALDRWLAPALRRQLITS